MKEIFSRIYKNNEWHSKESVSGVGSEIAPTRKNVSELKTLIVELGIFSILDAPCGDMNWIVQNTFPSVGFCGMDIVDQIIIEARKKYPRLRFLAGDISKDPLPRFDAIHIKDLFIHLSYKDIENVLNNILVSDIKYLIISNQFTHKENLDIKTGGFRHLNLLEKPFNLTPFRVTKSYIVMENPKSSNKYIF